MKKYWTIFTNGLLTENPLLVLMIGLCSSLAVTTRLENGLGMGLAMTFVLVMSEIIISLFRKLIPESIRIPVFIIVIASFTTIVDLLMQAYLPALSKSMGVFIPLIVVNCIIMGRVESFASKVSWFSQIPGFDVFPRSFKMLSRTAAISVPMSSTPRGVANSDWGPAYRILHQCSRRIFCVRYVYCRKYRNPAAVE